MFYGKRGQITAVMMLIVLLALGAGMYFYLRSTSEVARIDTDSAVLEKVPTQFEPITTFIADCLYKTAEEGALKIGSTGGYVSIEDSSLNGNAKIGNSFVPFTKSGNSKVVYWRAYDENSNSFLSKAPPLKGASNSIENQLESYIEAKIDSCLENFNQFKEQGFSFELPKKNAKVSVSSGGIYAELDYPVKISRAGTTSQIRKFAARVPVNLEKIFEIANEIARIENEQVFFEKVTNALLSIYSGDNPRPPPKDDIYTSFAPKIWVRSDVEREFKTIIQQYFSTFNIKPQGTQGADPYFTIPIPSDISQVADLGGLKVRFSYLYEGDFGWPFKMDICGNEVCRTESCAGGFPFPCQSMLSSYDIEFPVLVEITQEGAIKQNDYVFRFFLQSKIKNNYPMEAGLKVQDVGAAYFSSICDSSRRNSREITINVDNSKTGEPVAEAPLYFSVADESCLLGATDEKGELKTKLPSSTIGAVISTATDSGRFIGKSVNFDAGLSAENEVSIDVHPIINRKVNLQKYVYWKNTWWELRKTPRNLEDEEHAIISMTRRTEPDRSPFSVVFELDGGKNPDDYPVVGLAEGEYDADIILFKKDIVVIPKSTESIFWGFKKFTIPEVNFGIPPEGTTHIAKIEKLDKGGSRTYTVKCIDKSKYNPSNPQDFDYSAELTTEITLAPKQKAPDGQMSIVSRTKNDFKSREVYLAVETNADAECRHREDTKKDYLNPDGDEYKNYEPFDTSGLVHASKLTLDDGDHSFYVICREKVPNSKWVEIGQGNSIKLSAKNGIAREEADANPIIISFPGNPAEKTFENKEAIISAETSQETLCYYADSTNGKSDDEDYKPMGIPKETDFVEGGYKGKIIIEDLEDKNDAFTFYALDMGIDDTPQDKRSIGDLEHWSDVEGRSKVLENFLQPKG